MAEPDPSPLVDTAWLAEHLDAPDVRVVDGSYYLPHEGRDPRALYEEQHIPGAVFFDIDEIADTDSDLPHMLPSPEKFSSRVRALGLGDGVRIVVYDQRGLWSAPRVWWTFRVFGHRDVVVLDGGLPKWLREGRPMDLGPGRAEARHFTARVDQLLVRDREQLLANLTERHEQVLDARSRGRFVGADPEPRPDLRGGHIPGSLNLPFTELFEPESGTLLPPEVLRRKFVEAGVDLSRPVVTTCGSGITAAVLALGLERAGHRDVAVYDGSWADWGRPGATPVESGEAEPAGSS
ncbi:MAG TPA: 3-mercaptopyruvate sulfurtransferase [Kiloniellales bacterium]|nr:3-mercaptopyruvate sulfurtransferase [Kiloniellales bacterium]